MMRPVQELRTRTGSCRADQGQAQGAGGSQGKQGQAVRWTLTRRAAEQRHLLHSD